LYVVLSDDFFVRISVLIGTCHGGAVTQTVINPLMLELNPSAQRCLMRFFTGDFAS
jgi:hypothetical protein